MTATRSGMEFSHDLLQPTPLQCAPVTPRGRGAQLEAQGSESKFMMGRKIPQLKPISRRKSTELREFFVRVANKVEVRQKPRQQPAAGNRRLLDRGAHAHASKLFHEPRAE